MLRPLPALDSPPFMDQTLERTRWICRNRAHGVGGGRKLHGRGECNIRLALTLMCDFWTDEASLRRSITDTVPARS